MACRNGTEVAHGDCRRSLPPALQLPHTPELWGSTGGNIYSTAAAREAALARTSSPPRLIVPGPSSFPPITCFMSDPSLGCLLSEKSAAPTERQLPACVLAGPSLLCFPSVQRGRGTERTQRQAGRRGAAPGVTKQEPQHNSTQRAQHQQLCPSNSAPAALPQHRAGTLDQVHHPFSFSKPQHHPSVTATPFLPAAGSPLPGAPTIPLASVQQ